MDQLSGPLRILVDGKPNAEGNGNALQINLMRADNSPVPYKEAALLLHQALGVLLEKAEMSLSEEEQIAPMEKAAPDGVPPAGVPPNTVTFPGDLSN